MNPGRLVPLCLALPWLLIAVLALVECLSGCGEDERSAAIPRTYAKTEHRPVASAPSRAERAATQFGLRNVKTVGTAGLWSCGEHDSWMNSATVEGENQLGVRIRATVCCGWMKGCTVRFE